MYEMEGLSSAPHPASDYSVTVAGATYTARQPCGTPRLPTLYLPQIPPESRIRRDCE
jgi:hypothetical protein